MDHVTWCLVWCLVWLVWLVREGEGEGEGGEFGCERGVAATKVRNHTPGGHLVSQLGDGSDKKGAVRVRVRVMRVWVGDDEGGNGEMVTWSRVLWNRE